VEVRSSTWKIARYRRLARFAVAVLSLLPIEWLL